MKNFLFGIIATFIVVAIFGFIDNKDEQVLLNSSKAVTQKHFQAFTITN